MVHITIDKGLYQLQIWQPSTEPSEIVRYAVYKRNGGWMLLQTDIYEDTLDRALQSGRHLLNGQIVNDAGDVVIDEVQKRQATGQ